MFTLPLLIYGLNVAAPEAVAVSLAATGGTALVGAVRHGFSGRVEWRAVAVMALSGFVGAPVGAELAHHLPSIYLLTGFAVLMLVLTLVMWRRASGGGASAEATEAAEGIACRYDPRGGLHWNSRCVAVVTASGIAVGFFSGLFGVGGGFLIVPALTLGAMLPMHRSVASSLPVIALVSAVGFASHMVAGGSPDWGLVVPFWVGGVGGLFLGTRLSHSLNGPWLQRVFAVMLVLVACWILAKEWVL